MATLPDHAIETLCLAGMVTPFDPEMLNPASLDRETGRYNGDVTVQSSKG